MAHRVLIPTALRPFTSMRAAVEVEGPSLGELLQALVRAYPELRPHLYADDGRLRSYVNVYVNEDDFRTLQREETPLAPGDVVSLVPAIAGGMR
jgi:molybdopterin converting factor small subunit